MRIGNGNRVAWAAKAGVGEVKGKPVKGRADGFDASRVGRVALGGAGPWIPSRFDAAFNKAADNAAKSGARVRQQEHQGKGGKEATVRAVTFNWTQRYRKGGDAADERMLDSLKAKGDVLGLPEARWAFPKITDHEKGWAFYNPNPKGDRDAKPVGQVLGWNTKKFKLLEKGFTPLSKKTRIQQQAAGPTMARAKNVVWAKLRHRETGEVWTVAVAHLVPSKHLGGAAAKLWRKQRDALTKWMEKQGPRTILMGDFNGEWNDKIAKPFHEVAKAATAPSHGKRRIDWVLRSKDLKGGPGHALSNQGQSDHRPVVATVRG